MRACTPAGDVPIEEPDPGEAVGPTVPGETCKEATLNGPSRSVALTLSLRVGLLDGSGVFGVFCY